MAQLSKDVSEEKAENHAKEGNLKVENGVEEENGDEEAVNQSSLLLQVKSPWNKEHSSDKDEEVMSEIDARDLTGNKKRKDTPRKQGLCFVSKKRYAEESDSVRLYKVMYIYLLLFGNLQSGAIGRPIDHTTEISYRNISVHETKPVTKWIPIPDDGSRFSIISTGTGTVTSDYDCTVDNAKQHGDCSIVVGDEEESQCGGLYMYISRNESHLQLAVDGSNLTDQCYFLCIFQEVPLTYALYSSLVCKIAEGNPAPPTLTTLDPARDDPNSVPQHNLWKWFLIALLIVFFLVVLGIVSICVMKKRFPTHYDRLICRFRESNSRDAVPSVDPDQEMDGLVLLDKPAHYITRASVQEDAESSADSGAPSGLNTRDGSLADVLNTRDGSLADVTLDANTTVTTEIEGP